MLRDLGPDVVCISSSYDLLDGFQACFVSFKDGISRVCTIHLLQELALLNNERTRHLVFRGVKHFGADGVLVGVKESTKETELPY